MASRFSSLTSKSFSPVIVRCGARKHWVELLLILQYIFRHGAQNAYDSASKATLENEFGTSNEDECMTKILETGDLQHTEVRQDGEGSAAQRNES